jgi:hypothetical protein
MRPFEVAKPIVEYVLKRLIEEGFTLESVEYDDYESEPATTVEEALEHSFAVDFSTVSFKGGNWIVVIPENGTDVLSDWCCNDERFNDALESISRELEHYQCPCGHTFPKKDATTESSLIEKRPGYYAVHETYVPCPKCGYDGLDEITKAPE